MQRLAVELRRRESFDEDVYEADLQDFIDLYDQAVEDDIDTFVGVITSPERLDSLRACVTCHEGIKLCDSNTQRPLPRRDVWNGNVLEPV